MDQVRLVDGAIDAAAVLRDLASPSDGAVALFLGTVRDRNEGRQVLRLEYHAYREMAQRKLEEIAAEAHARSGASTVALIHRLGTLEIGEVSVLVAVAAPHRAEAFAACRRALERIKHEVPIWKKEHFHGGEIWIAGCRPE